jgi:ABC-type lipoprotein export system ATPase subunit
MNIDFQQVMPEPLRSIQHGENSIWGNHFQLQSGQKVLLNASSGKGKTTFTHTLAGIRQDYSGKLLFDGVNIADLSLDELSDLRQRKVSFVFQDLQLFPELTVAENLHIKNELTGVYTSDELKEMLNKLGILDKWDAPCKLLSMGQQQRVAIIRALSQPFEWLIMDEPFSHLDETNTQKCINLIIKRCNEQKAGMILTTLGDQHGIQYDRELNL